MPPHVPRAWCPPWETARLGGGGGQHKEGREGPTSSGNRRPMGRARRLEIQRSVVAQTKGMRREQCDSRFDWWLAHLPHHRPHVNVQPFPQGTSEQSAGGAEQTHLWICPTNICWVSSPGDTTVNKTQIFPALQVAKTDIKSSHSDINHASPTMVSTLEDKLRPWWGQIKRLEFSGKMPRDQLSGRVGVWRAGKGDLFQADSAARRGPESGQ